MTILTLINENKMNIRNDQVIKTKTKYYQSLNIKQVLYLFYILY
jgi:hypothetical protein